MHVRTHINLSKNESTDHAVYFMVHALKQPTNKIELLYCLLSKFASEITTSVMTWARELAGSWRCTRCLVKKQFTLWHNLGLCSFINRRHHQVNVHSRRNAVIGIYERVGWFPIFGCPKQVVQVFFIRGMPFLTSGNFLGEKHISNAVNRTEYSSDTNTNTYLNFAMLEKVTPITLF